MEAGGVLASLMAEIARDAAERDRRCPRWRTIAPPLAAWMLGEASLDDRLAGSVPFQTMCAVAVGGWLLLRQARAAEAGEAPPALAKAKPVVARYFLDHVVPEAAGLKASATAGAATLYALDAEELAG